MKRPFFPYRRRLAASLVVAALAHVAILAALGVFRDTAETGPWGIPGADSTLAPLPTIGERNAVHQTRAPRIATRPVTHKLPPVTEPTPVVSSTIVSVPAPAAQGPVDTAAPQSPITRGAATTEGEKKYSATQDSIFARGLRLNGPPQTRFRRDIGMTDSAWHAEEQRRANIPENIIRNNLVFSPEELQPTERQKMDYAHDTHPGAPSDVMPNIARAGVSFDFSARSLLGLDEDVSATISYTLVRTSRVRVAILTVKGDVVAHLFDGTQDRGKHTITWDGADERGLHVAAGDYVVEVLVNNDHRYVKHIVIS